jgi:hypothetical protein
MVKISFQKLFVAAEASRLAKIRPIKLLSVELS